MKIKRSKKSGQEEMVGFAVIIIIVALILLIFIGFSLKKSQKNGVESYEVESYVQSLLQYTTNCESYLKHFSVQDLIFECSNKEKCLDGRDTCDVLKENIDNISKESWNVGNESPTKGYKVEVSSDGEDIINEIEGNMTSNYKSASQNLVKSSVSVEVNFEAYY